MAAPVVSRAAALLLQQIPALTPDQVKARLLLTAFKNLVPYSTVTDPLTGISYIDQSDIFTVGAGYLDIRAALASTAAATPIVGSALSPSTVMDGNGHVVRVRVPRLCGAPAPSRDVTLPRASTGMGCPSCQV